MDLSAAILKGCEIHPEQCRQSLWLVASGPMLRVQSCVVGAAYEGTFGPIKYTYDVFHRTFRIHEDPNDTHTDATQRLRTIYPVLDTEVPGKSFVRCRALNGEVVEDVVVKANISLESHLYWLNDREGWTRQQIAAYVKYVVEGAPMIPEDD